MPREGESEYTYRLRCKLSDLQKQHDGIVSRMQGLQEAIDIAEKVDAKPAPGFGPVPKAAKQ